MKRPKIFLGVTTFLLVIASVATAKFFGPPTQRWYITFAGNKCVSLNNITCTSGPNPMGVRQCTTTVTIGGITRHLKVYTQGAVGAAANCIGPLLYTRAD